jgi:hypothetical protein
MRAKDRGFTDGLTMTVPATRAFEADRDAFAECAGRVMDDDVAGVGIPGGPGGSVDELGQMVSAGASMMMVLCANRSALPGS